MSTEVEPNLPAEAWEQDVPVGGAYDGREPRAALVTTAYGIGTVREVPALAGSAVELTGSTGQVMPLLSASPQRRGFLVAATGAAVKIATSRPAAEALQGLRIAVDQSPVWVPYAGEVFVVFTGAGTVSALACVDQG